MVTKGIGTTTVILIGIVVLVLILASKYMPNVSTVVRTIGQQESSFLVQKINSDSVEGIWYQAYPVPRGEGTPKTLHIGDNIGYGCEGISEKVTKIDFDAQTVTFTKVVVQRPDYGCPICLSGNTFIDTPNGPVKVNELRTGMLVWTADRLGHNESAIILKVGKTQVHPTHKVVHLILDDGRELFASQGHPTADGRMLGGLKSGDVIDNSHVKTTELVPYGQMYTYDLLPSGDTGFYFANGVLVGSTLGK